MKEYKPIKDKYPYVPCKSLTYYEGSMWPTNNSGAVTIIGRYGSYEYVVRFPTGYITKTTTTNLREGKVRDKYTPRVYDIGYIGEGAYETKAKQETKEYFIWHGMLKRCYTTTLRAKYPTYKDCTVDPRWHNFQNFCEDIQELEGYAEWKANTKLRAWHLDKDIKVKGNKIYSKDTCMFVTCLENVVEAGVTGKGYIGTRLSDGYREEFYNIRAFARMYGLNKASVHACIHGKYKHTQGWVFVEKNKLYTI